MRLYDLADQYLDLLEHARDGGEDVDYEAMLDGMEGAIKEKLDNYCKVVRMLEADVEALKCEISRLSQRKTTVENHIVRIKAAMKDGMMRMGMEKHKSPLFSVSFTTPRERVDVYDMTVVPSEYIKHSDPTADKIAIGNALKGGAIVPGARLVLGESGLSIQ